MVNLEEAIEASKQLIGGSIDRRFTKFCCGYFATTENIAGYLRNLELNKEKALVPIASGDHIFNLAYLQVKKIDAFDINELTYYTFYLKRALILALPYIDYLDAKTTLFYQNTDKLEKFFEYLKPFMPEDVYLYYMAMIGVMKNDFYANLENLFRYSHINKYYNLYLESEETYEKFKKSLKDINVNFIFGNAIDLSTKLDGNYDIILLSNIADYLFTTKDIKNGRFLEYLKGYYDLLNYNGVLINYVYDYRAFHGFDGTSIGANFEKIKHFPNDGYIRARKR